MPTTVERLISNHLSDKGIEVKIIPYRAGVSSVYFGGKNTYKDSNGDIKELLIEVREDRVNVVCDTNASIKEIATMAPVKPEILYVNKVFSESNPSATIAMIAERMIAEGKKRNSSN